MMGHRRRTQRNRRRLPAGDRVRAAARPLALAGRLLTATALPTLLTAGIVGMVWAGWSYVATTPYFRLHSVTMQGIDRVAREEILSQAGLEMGVTPTLGLDEAAVAARVRAHPWVHVAEVELRLPDHLSFRVTEHRPEAVVMLGQPYLSDRFGNLFAKPGTPAEVDLPTVTGLDREAALADRAHTRVRVKEALAVIREWRRQGLNELDALSEIHLDPVMGLTLYTRDDGAAIRLGWCNAREQLSRLHRLLSTGRPEGSRLEYALMDNEIDPGWVVARFVDRSRPPGTMGLSTGMPQQETPNGTQG